MEMKEMGKVRILADVPVHVKEMLKEINKVDGTNTKEFITRMIEQRYEEINQERAN